MHKRPLEENRLSVNYIEDWASTENVFERYRQAPQIEMFPMLVVKVGKSKTNSGWSSGERLGPMN